MLNSFLLIESVFNSIVPLVHKAKKLTLLFEYGYYMKYVLETLPSISNLTELTMNGICREVFRMCESMARSVFPNMRRLIFRYPDGDYIIEKDETHTLRPSVLSFWCSDSVLTSDSSFGRDAESFLGRLKNFHNKIANSIVPLEEKPQIYSWHMRGWSCDCAKVQSEFKALKALPNLREVKLPSGYLYEELDFPNEFQGFVEKSGFILPTVQNLHFVKERTLDFTSFDAEKLLLRICNIFPNVRSLSLAPASYLKGGEFFHYLTTQTELSNLMILHNRWHHRVMRCLDFRTWLPFTVNLDAFLFYTRQLMWRNESTQMVFCLCRNKSLRHVCIISNVDNSTGPIGLTASDVEELGSKWYADKGRRYLIFGLLRNGKLTCFAVKPSIFEQNTFASWLDLERVYLELYSVF